MPRLTLLHTNDLHGRVPQLLRIATLVRRIRSEVQAAGGCCLYVDAGDSEDTVQLESSLTRGSSMNAILRGAGCDYVALGNAIPLRYGEQAIADLAVSLGRPLLCANFLDQNDALVAGLEPFTIHDFGSFRLGIIGLTDPMQTYANVFKLHPQKPAEILPELIRQARTRGAQTILILSHLGLKMDVRLAETISGFDLIIGGHSHDALNPPLLVNGRVIAQAGEYGSFLGCLDLEIDASGRVVHFEGRLLPVDESLPPDPAAQSVLESERVRAQAMMDHSVGMLADPFDLADDRECAAGNLLADALLDRIRGAEVALALAGHWETGLVAGSLTRGALFAAIRSTANPARLELTGAQIHQFLSVAIQTENIVRTPRELRGHKLGWPHVSGLTAQYDSSNMEVKTIRVGNVPLEHERKYVIAATDVEVSEWVNYLFIPDEQVEYEVPAIMPEVLEQYITKRVPLRAGKKRIAPVSR